MGDIVSKVHVKWLWFRLFMQVFINKLSCARSNCSVVITLYRRLLTDISKKYGKSFLTVSS